MENQAFCAGESVTDGTLLPEPGAQQCAAVAQGKKNALWMGLPDRLKRARKAAGLSQRALARCAGCSENVPRFVESRANRPGINIVEKLAAGLGVPVCWLAFGHEGTEPFRKRKTPPVVPFEDPVPEPGSHPFRARFELCGERIRQVREQHGYTLRYLASYADTSYQTILNAETSATVPNVETIEAIAVALDVAPCWLAYGDEDQAVDRAAS